jgi:hypothetical protein
VIADGLHRCEHDIMRAVVALLCVAVIVEAPVMARADEPPSVPIDGSPAPPGLSTPPAGPKPPKNHTLAGAILIGLAFSQIPGMVAGAVLLTGSDREIGAGILTIALSGMLLATFLSIGIPYYVLGRRTPEEKARREHRAWLPSVAPLAGAHGLTGGTFALSTTF